VPHERLGRRAFWHEGAERGGEGLAGGPAEEPDGVEDAALSAVVRADEDGQRGKLDRHVPQAFEALDVQMRNQRLTFTRRLRLSRTNNEQQRTTTNNKLQKSKPGHGGPSLPAKRLPAWQRGQK
jgi:hypothetical protein